MLKKLFSALIISSLLLSSPVCAGMSAQMPPAEQLKTQPPKPKHGFFRRLYKNIRSAPWWKKALGFAAIAGGAAYAVSTRSEGSLPKVTRFDVGIAAEQGNRPTMEDAHAAHALNNETDFFLVADGHGGAFTSNYVAKHLPRNIRAALAQGLSLADAVAQGFEATDNELKKAYEIAIENGDITKSDGSTAITITMQKNIIIAGNVGDSRGVAFNTDGSTTALSTDHTPTEANEAQRLEDLNAWVNKGQLGNAIGVSRSFGHYGKYKHGKFVFVDKKDPVGLTAEPEIRELSSDTIKFIIIACDGIWDVMSNEQATELVNNALLAGKTTQHATKILVDEAIRRLAEHPKRSQPNQGDNCSAMVILINN